MYLLKVKNLITGQEQNLEYANLTDAEEWASRAVSAGAWGNSGEYEYSIQDISQISSERELRKQTRKADRDSRIDQFKKIDWNSVDTIAKLKAIVRSLVKEAIKDEE